MTRTITLAHAADVAGWRAAAREAVADNIAPHAITWTVNGGDLLAPAHVSKAAPSFSVPRRFVTLADSVLLHRDNERFALMYRILWRLQRSPQLLEDASDADIHRAAMMAKSIGRDIHKMHAFVRFREVEDEQGKVFLAWFEPEHHVVDAASRHFVDRFASMRWAILTPERSAVWNGNALSFGPGATRDAVPAADRFDDHWRAYYRSIFNPARLKISAMTKEMPKKYWHNLPEATEIAPLIRAAAQRTMNMIDALPTVPSAMTGVEQRRRPVELASVPDIGTLEGLRESAEECARCPLAATATQTVFGEGPARAAMMIVGEQPGDQEDLAGKPFVGPAGQLLDRALSIAQIRRTEVYVTNAVKHFKFEPRGKRRLHKSPTAGEVSHCRWWLNQERLLVKPRLIVALGATAARSVLGRAVRIGAERGRATPLQDGSHVWITVHPSYILRLPRGREQDEELEQFIAELAGAQRWLARKAA
jgi:probable DNA metabolism protein